jgi:tight adherence protein B
VIGGPLVLRLVIGQRLTHQRRLFADQLPGHLEELAAAMRAGHSMVGAIAAMVGGATEPTRSEFQRVLADEQLGTPLEEALHPVSRRMANDDMEQVALVAALHQRTGGNMAEVLDRVADAVRERAELRRELHALTAQARLSRWIVTALPPAVLLLISVINPSYVAPLYHTAQGQLLLVVAAAMVIAGSLVMKQLVRVEA